MKPGGLINLKLKNMTTTDDTAKLIASAREMLEFLVELKEGSSPIRWDFDNDRLERIIKKATE